jgi:hypothetical protein
MITEKKILKDQSTRIESIQFKIDTVVKTSGRPHADADASSRASADIRDDGRP